MSLVRTTDAGEHGKKGEENDDYATNGGPKYRLVPRAHTSQRKRGEHTDRGKNEKSTKSVRKLMQIRTEIGE